MPPVLGWSPTFHGIKNGCSHLNVRAGSFSNYSADPRLNLVRSDEDIFNLIRLLLQLSGEGKAKDFCPDCSCRVGFGGAVQGSWADKSSFRSSAQYFDINSKVNSLYNCSQSD